jgi:SAM-dependent methyltransferase
MAGLKGTILQSDARNLPFPDHTFDFVYSWGVLHHSPDLSRSLSELVRVLRPGGKFGVMLYHRNSLYYQYHILYVEGFLHRERRFLNPLQLASRYGDGCRDEGNPHTWPVTQKEAKAAFQSAGAKALDTRLLGTELDTSLRFLLPGLSFFIPVALKKPWARRFGWSLWISGAI